MKILSLLLSVALLSGSAPPDGNISEGVPMDDGTTQYLIENAVYAWFIPIVYTETNIFGIEEKYTEYEAYILHSNGETSFWDLSKIDRIEPLDGVPTAAYVYYLGPHQLVTTYVDWQGYTRTITTNCKGLTDIACIKKHTKMVQAMQKAHPPAPGGGQE